MDEALNEPTSRKVITIGRYSWGSLTMVITGTFHVRPTGEEKSPRTCEFRHNFKLHHPTLLGPFPTQTTCCPCPMSRFRTWVNTNNLLPPHNCDSPTPKKKKTTAHLTSPPPLPGRPGASTHRRAPAWRTRRGARTAPATPPLALRTPRERLRVLRLPSCEKKESD